MCQAAVATSSACNAKMNGRFGSLKLGDASKFIVKYINRPRRRTLELAGRLPDWTRRIGRAGLPAVSRILLTP